jgi:hypothetical protein
MNVPSNGFWYKRCYDWGAINSWFLVLPIAWSANNGQLVEILTVLGLEGY